MSNIDKIRQEIERRRDICKCIFERDSDTYYQGKSVAYGEVLAFIDSLPEEKPSEDLEKAADDYVCRTTCDTDDGPSVGMAKDAFEAGAEWMANRRREK